MADFAEARWWRAQEDGRIACDLCPHACRIREGQHGICGVRRQEGGRLLSCSYGYPTGFAVDPIEKKPLFHFLPGSRILSFGTLGCTLGCPWCQNWPQAHAEERAEAGPRRVSPEEVVELARREGVPSIAYTYNEPTVFAEFWVDVARLARRAGLRNVAVTNGFITPAARAEVYAELDAANVDLKGFSEEFYRREAKGALQPVLDTLEWIARETKIWLEITTLLIPGLNDDDETLARECDWIRERLGTEVPVHFTAFHPDFEMRDTPHTPPETLTRAREIARRRGLRFLYTGNVADPDGQRTVCPTCRAQLIERTWHASRATGLADGRCAKCGTPVPGVW
jgi:pyruvate formate lyase activating enzyme